MHWYAGTSGYSYKEWKGTFYPEGIAADGMLAYYASQLPAVEINNTFYRMPRTNVLETWRDATPDDFRFVIKASRRITHQAKLADCEDSIEYLASKLEAIESKIACVLFQLPPYLRKDAGLLDGFLGAWPSAYPASVEFRHASWFDEETAEVLRKHQAAICISEDTKLDAPDFYVTTDWVYLRLRKPNYDEHALTQWIDRVSEDGVKTGYAFFKHEDDGAGPALATSFLHLADPTSANAAEAAPVAAGEPTAGESVREDTDEKAG